MASLSPQEFLTQHLEQQDHSIHSYQYQQQTVWIKKAGKRHSIWLYKLLGLVTKSFKLKALTPVPNLGGTAAIQIEAKRIKHLQQHGINVPKLLAHNSEGLMLADVGTQAHPAQQLEAALKNCQNAADCLELYTHIVDEVHAIHQKGLWLSEAFLRNMMLDKNNDIAFLDFESDPGKYMNKKMCFARDWLCLIFSSSIYLKQHGIMEEASHYLHDIMQQESQQTYRAVVAVTRVFNWLAKIPLEKLGKDGYRLTAVITVLAYIKTLT